MKKMNPAALAAVREAARNKATGKFGAWPYSPPEQGDSIDAAGDPRAVAARVLDTRVKQLKDTGYAEVGAMPSMHDPSNTARRGSWWQSQFALAEQAKGGGFHIMPDDYTPGQTDGRSLLGKRRTHRMKYEGAGVTLRMPSVTAVKRYSKDIKGATFDLPVEARTPAGTVQTHVRVSPGPDGTWEVSSPGLTGQPELEGYVSESVRATLEGQRVRTALKDAGDLAERRRKRIADMGVKMYEPKADGSVVKGVGYSRAGSELYVQLGNRNYAYDNATPRLAGQLYRAHVPGSIYNSQVKGKFPSAKAESCDDCGRVTSSKREHECPPEAPKAKRTMKFERLMIQRAIGMKEHRSFERAFDRALEERSNWQPA